MSTFYATFESTQKGRQTVDELLRDGVPPENISLIADYHTASGETELVTGVEKLGDVSFFVGRPDDPEGSMEAQRRLLVARVAHLQGSSMGGIDTSDVSLDVESVDQTDDSQEIAEESLYPFRGVSYGSHESDEVRTEMATNFPTRPDRMDDTYDTETPMEDQNVDGLESFSLPGRGTVIGSGALATVALDLLDPTKYRPAENVYRYLVEDGVPRPDAEDYRRALMNGEALIAVEIVPGRIHESRVEDIIERNEGQRANLFDAHRFHDHGAPFHEHGGGQS